MHYHAYSYLGPGITPDRAIGRSPEDRSTFNMSEIPPSLIYWWLLRPARQIRGTWGQPTDAVTWFIQQYNESADSMLPPSEEKLVPLGDLEKDFIGSLSRGRDVAWFSWLNGARYLELCIVCCSPNFWGRDVPCPQGITAKAS